MAGCGKRGWRLRSGMKELFGVMEIFYILKKDCYRSNSFTAQLSKMHNCVHFNQKKTLQAKNYNVGDSDIFYIKKVGGCGPTAVAQARSMPAQGSRPGCGPPQEALTDVSLTHHCFSPSLAPSLSLSLRINTYNLF